MKKLFLAVLLGFAGLAFGMGEEDHKNCEGDECSHSQESMDAKNDSQESTMEESETSTDSK